MQHKQGEERNQMVVFSLESAIAADSFVRVVDAFVDTLVQIDKYDKMTAKQLINRLK